MGRRFCLFFTLCQLLLSGALAAFEAESEVLGVGTENAKKETDKSLYKDQQRGHRQLISPSFSPTQTPIQAPMLTPKPTNRPSPLSGPNLYQTNCAGCHGPLTASSKRGATTSRIQTAILNNFGGMGFLSSLSSAAVDAIATALK